MVGVIRDPNNPARVPPILARIDQPQEGLPRIIHPVGMAVGRPDPAARRQGVISTMSDQFAADVVIEEDATYVNEHGDPFQFRAGDRVSAARAAGFPELAKKVAGTIVGTGLARSEDERPDVAPTDDPSSPPTPNPITRRVMPEPLENKAERGARQARRAKSGEGE